MWKYSQSVKIFPTLWIFSRSWESFTKVWKNSHKCENFPKSENVPKLGKIFPDPRHGKLFIFLGKDSHFPEPNLKKACENFPEKGKMFTQPGKFSHKRTSLAGKFPDKFCHCENFPTLKISLWKFHTLEIFGIFSCCEIFTTGKFPLIFGLCEHFPTSVKKFTRRENFTNRGKFHNCDKLERNPLYHLHRIGSASGALTSIQTDLPRLYYSQLPT